MEMQVEIYDMLESTELELCEITDDSKHLIEVLQLDGQKGLITGDNKTVQPYNKLTKDQQFICSVLFPKCTDIKNYHEGPIPYRVLKEAAAAKEHFQFLYILHEAPIYIKDPVLVGSTDSIYGDITHAFQWRYLSLIARWGTALDSWENLLEKASQQFIKTQIQNFNCLKQHVDNSLQLLQQGIKPTNEAFSYDGIVNLLPYKY
jgi:hypothetical protein